MRWECADTCTDLWQCPQGDAPDYFPIESASGMESITSGEHHGEMSHGACTLVDPVANTSLLIAQGTGLDSSPYVSAFNTEEMYKEIIVNGVTKQVNDGVKISTTLFHAPTNGSGKFFHLAMPTLYKRWCRQWGGDSYIPTVFPAGEGFYGLPWVRKDKYQPLVIPMFMSFNIRSNSKYQLSRAGKNLYYQFDIKTEMDAEDLGARNDDGTPISLAEGGLQLQGYKAYTLLSAYYDLHYQYTDNITPYVPNGGLINYSNPAIPKFLEPRKVNHENLNIELAIWLNAEINPLIATVPIKSQWCMSSLKPRLIFKVGKFKLFYQADFVPE